MAYTAPDFKDRVAIGDNKYTMTDAGDGKILLTPAPDEVTEAGTDINKAIMQPLCDTVENIDSQLLPYNLYYWLSRGISGYYSETQQLAYSHSGSYYYKSGTSGIYDRIENYIISLFYFNASTEQTSCTVQYSSSINISQTNGTVTLSNPTTRRFTSDESNSSIQSVLQGKYVKGLRPATEQIFYVPSGSRITTAAWAGEGGENYRGYIWIVYNYADLADGSGPKVMYISSKYNSTNTDWGVISSTEPDTYPASGTVDGTEYIKLGRIDEAFLNYARNNPSAFQDIIASYEARISALEAAIAGI